MKWLPLILLTTCALFAQDSTSLRVAVFLADAPMYGEPQLASIQKRFQGELSQFSGKLPLVFVEPEKGCFQFQCALEMGRKQKLDYVIVSRLQAKGGSHDYEVNAVNVLRGVTEARGQTHFGASLGEFEQLRPKIAEQIMADIQKALTVSGAAELLRANLQTGTPITTSVLSGLLPVQNSPYLVYGNIAVPAGEELLIEPGVVLYFIPGQSGGISVFGQLTAEGTADKPIRFLSASKEPKPWDWNRILISGDGRSSLRNVEIAHSNYGLHVENSGLTLQDAKVHDNSLRGLFVRNGQADVQDVEFSGGQVVAIQVSALGQVKVIRSQFKDNRNAMVVMPQGALDAGYSLIEGNDRGFVLLDGASLITEKNRVERNQIGVVSEFPIDMETFDGIRDNSNNLLQASRSTLESVLDEPNTQDVARAVVQGGSKGEVGERREPESWNTYGNIQGGGGYTKVITERNEGPLLHEIDEDTIGVGGKYPNQFTLNGPWATGNTYVIMESNKGRGIEVQGEARADRWVTARAKPITVRYWSPLHSLTIGHLNESGSPLLLSGFEVLGLKYLINMGKNAEEQPLFTAEAFAGESRRSFAEGDRNPDLFEDRFPEDGAIAQQLTAYGRIGFAPTPRLRFQTGAITSQDRSSDILIRESLGKSQELRDPLADAKAAFISAEWTSRRGGFHMRGDVAIGRADTADVFYQKALDQVFEDAGLSPVSLSQVRTLFLSNANIREADTAEVVAILGEELSLDQAKDSLLVLRELVMEEQNRVEKDGTEDRVANMTWKKQNVASRLVMDWSYTSGAVQVSLQNIGSRYFSPGASGTLQNSREYGIDWTQTLKPFWDIHGKYLLSVENAANEDAGSSNLIGFGEGTSVGIMGDKDWKQEHLMDANRARYVHQAQLDHSFRIGSALGLTVGYQLEHSRQNMPTKLKADLSTDAAVMLDPWFRNRNGRSTVMADIGYGDSIEVDSVRWTAYQAMGNEDSIAWGFQDIRTKHALSTGVTWSRKAYTVKAGGEWTLQLDQSEFSKDALVQDLKLKDSTWQKLGYHPEAQTWFEHSYPLSLSMALGKATNKASFKPRWRFYKKDEQAEFEYSFSDRFEWPILNRKMIWSLTGQVSRQINEVLTNQYAIELKSDSTQYRYYRMDDNGILIPVASALATDTRVQGGEEVPDGYRILRAREKEITRQWDLALETSFRVNWTTRLFTELTGRVDDFRRPDQLDEQHRDVTGSLNVYYSF